jgi:hypothetical protein
LTLAVLLAAARAGIADTANALTPEEAAEGWVSLFDGQSVRRVEIAGDYQIQDGVLRIGGDQPAAVVLRGHFLDDFEIRFDYQLSGSAGVSPWVHHVPSWGANGEGFQWGLDCTKPPRWGRAHYHLRFRGKTVSLVYGSVNDSAGEPAAYQVHPFSEVRGYVDFLRLDVPAGHMLSLRNLKIRENQAAWIGWWVSAVIVALVAVVTGVLLVYRRSKKKPRQESLAAGC